MHLYGFVTYAEVLLPSGKPFPRLNPDQQWMAAMCECFNYIPAPVRTRFLDTIEGRPSLSVYDAVFRLQNMLHRSTYHQLLRWADGLADCNHCRPKLKRR